MSSSALPTPTVGVVGLGRMGRPMTHRLIDAGFDVIVFHRDHTRTESLVSHGARRATSVAELGAACDRVLLSLPDEGAVAQVVTGRGGLMSTPNPPDMVIDTTTTSPAAARAMAADLVELGSVYVECPVSGSSRSASRGELTALLGGEEADLAAAAVILAPLTKARIRVGPVGAASAAKIALNIVVAGVSQAVNEALELAAVGGVPAHLLYAVLVQSAVSSPLLDYKRETFLGNSSEVAFTIDLMVKDLGLAERLAQETTLNLPLLDTAVSSLRLAQEKGAGSQDFGALRRVLRDHWRVSAHEDE